MIAIPSINASDGLDPFDRVQLPIQGFFQNKRIDHALHIATRNHREKRGSLLRDVLFLWR